MINDSHIESVLPGKIDWEELKREVLELKDVLAQETHISYENKREILKKRAKELSKSILVEQSDLADTLEIIEFGLADEIYGIEMDFVREVCPLKEYTPIPGVPEYVLGIINVRGQVVSVINIKKLMGIPESGLGELNKVLIVRNENMEFGILADVIYGTNRIILNTLRDTVCLSIGVESEYLKAVSTEHKIILDIKKMLDDQQLVVSQELI